MYYLLVSPFAYGGVDKFDFTYSSDIALPIGAVVQIPFGRQKSLGVITGVCPKPNFATKPVSSALEIPPLPAHLIELARWMHGYYLASPKSIWTTMLPAGLTAKRRGAASSVHLELPKMKSKLTPEQEQAIKAISEGSERTYLLRGVTGSGKTQVYIELAKKSIKAGKSVIVLVPEIALTPQTIGRFEAEFKGIIVSRHSKQTPAQRHLIWESVLGSNKPQIVVGPRSNLFLPLKKLGLIIIDESHESTYKQEQSPRYQADAVAAKLASLTDAKLVLGSATPSINQYFLASVGRIKPVELHLRTNLITQSKAKIVDLRNRKLLKTSQYISEPLIDALRSTLEAGRQSLLFINRRGSASAQTCTDCGYVSICPHCRLPVTFHADKGKLICHSCNYRESPPALCPECQGADLRFLGVGTQRIEAEVAKLFPAARITRLDKDSFKPAVINQTYKDLHSGKTDILIGTQMIAKGLDLPKMDTIGIISADTMLYIPDFTASERTYQLIAQVSGRAGRGDRAGEVFIQTYTPEHFAIAAAAKNDYLSFAEAEIKQRGASGYPPFAYLLKLTLAGKNQELVQKKATEFAEQLEELPEIQILGPAPAFREIAAGNYHWQIIVKSLKRRPLVNAASNLPVGWTADLDPINLL